ncbi:MAG: HPF/RaiA family ribosome-associated protein [Candidatus Kaiserbacteria bacterium]|nr:MAG: HPF/RaiA family ribosome-associated protein [Candidatus Kaiserbacteria bacterium]
MDVRIKTTDYTLTPLTKDYLDGRIMALEKFLGDDSPVSRCEVEVGRDAGRPRHGANIWFAEVRLVIPGNNSIYARNNSESVNGAIDDVKEEIERQLRRERKIHIRLYRKGGALAKRLIRFGR